MKIVVQHKEVNKHTREVEAEEVSLTNEFFDGYSYVKLIIGDKSVDLPVSDLFTAVEAFHRHEVRHDEEQVRMCEQEALSRRP